MKETLAYVLKKNGTSHNQDRPETIDTARILFTPPKEKSGNKSEKRPPLQVDEYPINGARTMHRIGQVEVEICSYYQKGLSSFGKKIEVDVQGSGTLYTDFVELPNYFDTPANRKSVGELSQRVLDRLIEELVKCDGGGGDPYETLEGIWNVKSQLAKTIARA